MLCVFTVISLFTSKPKPRWTSSNCAFSLLPPILLKKKKKNQASCKLFYNNGILFWLWQIDLKSLEYK